MKIRAICSYFPSSTQLSTGVEDEEYVARRDNARLRRPAVSTPASAVTSVENRSRGRVVYTRGFLPFEADETT
jgi:hypothetical protein